MTDRPDTPEADRPLPTATAVIEAFGGIRPMAGKLGIPVTTVQGWKERDSIPKRRWAEIRRVAEAQGLDLEATPQGTGRAEGAIAMPADADKDADAIAPESGAAAASEPEEAPAAAPFDDTPWAASVPEDEIVAGQAETTAAGSAQDTAETTATAGESKPWSVPPATPAGTSSRRSRRGFGAWPWLALAFVVAGAAVTWSLWWPTIEKEAERAGILSPASDETQPATPPSDMAAAPAGTVEAPMGGAAGDATAADAGSADQSSVQAEIAALRKELNALRVGADNAEGDSGEAERIATLEKQVQSLSGTVDTRFSGLESRGATKAVESALAELRAENARLTEQFTALRKSVLAMERRLDAAEKRAGGEQVLMLAVGQLRAALMRGAPFRQELSALEGLSAEDESLAETIAPLWSHASIGVETEAELRARFGSLAPAVLSAEQGAAGGWTDRILAKLNDVVTIRRVGGDVEGDGADALLARAEARLAAGDLAGAVAIMDGLQGPAAAAAVSWLADARARLAADKTVAALESRVLAERAPGEG